MKTIMVATDFSERSDRALRRATLLARQYGAGIALVHAVDDDQPRRIVEAEREEAQKLLRQMAATLRETDGVACDTRVVLAAPFAGIVGAAQEIAPDLLVIGPHRRQVLRDVFAGTTAERTIQSAACPVLMVNAPPAGQYRRVLQTTDLSEGSREALGRFALLGLGERLPNTLLYVFDAPALHLSFGQSARKDSRGDYLRDETERAMSELRAFIASCTLGHVTPKVRYEASAAANEILAAAADEKADLIVLSARGRGGLMKLMLGSVTEEVLRIATVDVLTIPPAHRQ